MGFIRSRMRPSAAGYERPEGLPGPALVIGFGRIGQIVSQFLLARRYDISIIDSDVEMIDAAREYGFKVYYATAPGSTSCTPPAPARPARCWYAWTSPRTARGSSSS